MEGQYSVQNGRPDRCWLGLVSTVMLVAACQATDVLRVLPDDASEAVTSGGLRAPTNVTTTPLTFSQVSVAWTGGPNESGFQVFRSGTQGGGFTLLHTTAANVSSWTDTGLTGSTQYCYQLRATRGSGPSQKYSAFSTVSCATTPAPPRPPPPPPPPPPGSPYGFYAEPLDSLTIRVTWSDGSWNEDGFRVERSVDGGATWAVAGTVGANVLVYTQGDALAELGVCYRVFAFNVSGDSPPNGWDCAVPPAAPTNLALTVTAPGEIELTWTDNSAAEISYEVWVGYWDPYYSNWYEYPIAGLSANTTRYRTMLASTEYYSYVVYVAANSGSYSRATGYLDVPRQP